MSNNSSFWQPEKEIPSVSLNPPFKGNWFHVSKSSTFWQHGNVFLQGLCENRIKGILLSLRYNSVFLRPKNGIFNGHETLDPQASSIHKTSVRRFGGLTMRFCKEHVTLG
jgi:hypothetical protein